MIDAPDNLPPLKVAGFPIRFERVSESDATSDKRYGAFKAATQTIQYQDRFPTLERMADVLLHEILHAAWWAYGLRDEDDEERCVCTIAAALVQISADNPETWDRLMRWSRGLTA